MKVRAFYLLLVVVGCNSPMPIGSMSEGESALVSASEDGAEEVLAQHEDPDQLLADLAGEAAQVHSWERAMELYNQAAQSEDPFVKLEGISGQVAVARQAAVKGDLPWTLALDLTDELQLAHPERIAQWRLWEADTRYMSGDMEGALRIWLDTAEIHRDARVMDRSVRELALRQAARVARDLGDLDLAEGLRLEAEVAKAAPLPPAVASSTCTPSEASDGFQKPFTPDTTNWGNRFMTYDTTSYSVDLYHPGEDMNASSDCSMDFKPMAKGCVSNAQAVSPTKITDEGAATLMHRHTHADTSSEYWTSSYWHAYYIYYSIGSAVAKSAVLGKVGDVNAASCHLHLELREADHPSKDDMDYWDTSVLSNQTKVGYYYQDPMAFITGHPNYVGYFWADESNFTCSGAWTSSTSGDEGDSKYASATSSTSTPTSYCTYAFKPSSSATYYAYAHIPWVNTSSTYVPYTIYTTSSTSSIKMSVRVNQGTGTDTTGYGCGTGEWDGNHNGDLCDEWVYLGSFSATAATSYTLKIGNNTGESSSYKLALDDVLILRK